MLTMTEAIGEVVTDAGWKMKSLLRTKRFYCDADIVLLYKSHLLSFLEYRTPAVYHATRDVLCRLDNVQQRFLRDVGIDDLAALVHFNLAPLAARRDIALLGLICRIVLGRGPPHFRNHFTLAGPTDFAGRRLHSPALGGSRLELRGSIVSGSALGLVAIYNMLPGPIVMLQSVSSFQGSLQRMMVDQETAGCTDWAATYSPRLPLASHPLVVLGQTSGLCPTDEYVQGLRRALVAQRCA